MDSVPKKSVRQAMTEKKIKEINALENKMLNYPLIKTKL